MMVHRFLFATAVASTMLFGTVAEAVIVELYNQSLDLTGRESDWNGFGIMQDASSGPPPGPAWVIFMDDAQYSVEGGMELQSFDSEGAAAGDGWASRDAGPNKPVPCCVGPTDPTLIGFSNTNNAGGIAGEGGGTIARGSEPVGYYADTTIGTVSMANALSANGKLYLDGSTADNGVFIGWLGIAPGDEEQRELHFGFDIVEGSDPMTGNRSARVRIGIDGSNGGARSENVSVSDLLTKNPLLWTLDWNPDTKLLTGTISADVIPEPSAVVLACVGCVGLLVARRRFV